MNIKKGDTVKILAGKDRDKTGKIIKVDSKSDRVTVEGLNVYKKHVRPKKQGEKGQIVDVIRPMHYSNVALICPNCGKAVRTGYIIQEGKKSRCCRKCKTMI